MKKFLSRRRLSRLSSFTLVELLVVMGIIAIMAALLTTAGGAAIKSAKRAKAANMATQIQTASLGYYTEYGVYPCPKAVAALPAGTPSGQDWGLQDTPSAANQTAWKVLLCILCGNISPLDGTAVAATTITNSRGIAFLSLRKSDVYDSANPTVVAPLNPLPTGTGATQAKYFNIVMDANYDGVIGITASSGWTIPNFTGTFSSTTGGIVTSGVGLWENCTGSTTVTNANYWVHTY